MPKIKENAASQETIEEHFQLCELVEAIRATLAGPRVDQEVVADMLHELSVQLLEHFQHEEAGGYFAAALEAAPHLTHRSDKLLNQHPRMASLLATLVVDSKGRQASDRWKDEIVSGFRRFLDAFLGHEAEERDLLQEAFNQDIGPED